MKKVIMFLITLFVGFSLICINVKADSSNDYLNEENWINLPGYEYISYDVKPEDTDKLPATVIFKESTDDIGINLKLKGYYQSGFGDQQGNGYAGLVYKNKVSIDNFSVTFTCNKLGASSNASPADDGWIGISFLKNCNMFSTTNTDINMGAVALVRASNRGCIVYMHEIAEDGNDYKISNFAKGTNVSVELDVLPSFEGSTLRLSIVKEENPSGNKYFLKLEQIEFSTGKVITSKTSSNPLECPNLYMDESGKGYLAISASTDNYDKTWDISIKNICGTVIGTKEDAEPISATERANNIYDLIDRLSIYSYFDLNTSLSNEGKEFYSPNNELNINDLTTNLLVQLYNADNETLTKLSDMDAVSSNFDSLNDYLKFLNDCTSKIVDNYDTIVSDLLIKNINDSVKALPELKDVNLANEQEVSSIINDLQVYHHDMNEKTIAKYGEANYNNLWNEIIVKYSRKLNEVSIEKYDALSKTIPNTITKDNYKEAVINLVSMEKIYLKFADELNDIKDENIDSYNSIIAAKEIQDKARTDVNVLKEENQRNIEAFENAGLVLYELFYLSNNTKASDLEMIYNLVSKYKGLNTEAKKYITEKDKLLNAAVKALDLNIKAAPEAADITEANYVNKGYDTLVSTLNNYYNLIEEIDYTKVETLESKNKLYSLVGKLSALKNPLSSNVVSKIDLNATGEYSITFVQMFNNYLGRNYTITSNYGTVNKDMENITFNFTENGTYQVLVEIKDEDYSQSAKCEFTINVTGLTKENEPAEKKGCSSSLNECLIMFVTISLCSLALISLKKKEQYN